MGVALSKSFILSMLLNYITLGAAKKVDWGEVLFLFVVWDFFGFVFLCVVFSFFFGFVFSEGRCLGSISYLYTYLPEVLVF